jgi:hypothetical protein
MCNCDCYKFPQKVPYFHTGKFLKPSCNQTPQEYASTQRKRDLPEGESNQGTSGESETAIHAGFRTLRAADETRRLVQRNAAEVKIAEREPKGDAQRRQQSREQADRKVRRQEAERSASRRRNRSGEVVVIWNPNQIFEKSEMERARIRKETRPLRFYFGFELVIRPKSQSDAAEGHAVHSARSERTSAQRALSF